MNCQRCRQPLRDAGGSGPGIEDSLAALSPSAYDMLASTMTSASTAIRPPYNDISRVPPSLRGQYAAATNPQAYSCAPIRITSPYPTLVPLHNLHPGESFVVLTDSVVGSARTAAAAASSSGGDADTTQSDRIQPPSLTPRINQLQNLYQLLSANTSVDHPLCTECMDTLLGLMGKELEETKKERDRLVNFEKEVLRKREEPGAPSKETLIKEIAKFSKAEAQATEDLRLLEEERVALDREKAELDAEEAALAEEEAEFWREHSRYLLEAADLRDKTNALETKHAHELHQLEKLRKTNVYNDAFCIGHEAGFGTINKLRLGRLPSTPVEWPEINAAWGHTVLLLHTIARKFSFTFENYRLIPMGSFSKIERLNGDKAVYELYGSGDFNAVTRMLQNRRFDHAMVAFLDCLRQLMEFVKSKDRTIKLPHAVVKDRIGDVSIKYQFGSDEAWTRALRHVLFDLKILLARASM